MTEIAIEELAARLGEIAIVDVRTPRSSTERSVSRATLDRATSRVRETSTSTG